MRTFLIALISALALSATAVGNAGNVNLCNKDGWRTAQAGNGSAFTSQAACSKSKDVYRASLTLSASHVNVNEYLTANGAGFHANADVTVTVSVTGSSPYMSSTLSSDGSGNAHATIVFSDCGTYPPYDLTVRMADASGVSASARVTVC